MNMFYSTIKDQVNDLVADEVSYRNLHTNAYIRSAGPTGTGEIIKIPYKSITLDYASFFENTIITLPLTPQDRVKYRFKPKALSYDLYDTTELWHAILEINYIKSVAEFNLEKDPKVFVPSDFRKILNEIMVLEGVIT